MDRQHSWLEGNRRPDGNSRLLQDSRLPNPFICSSTVSISIASFSSGFLKSCSWTLKDPTPFTVVEDMPAPRQGQISLDIESSISLDIFGWFLSCCNDDLSFFWLSKHNHLGTSFQLVFRHENIGNMMERCNDLGIVCALRLCDAQGYTTSSPRQASAQLASPPFASGLNDFDHSDWPSLTQISALHPCHVLTPSEFLTTSGCIGGKSRMNVIIIYNYSAPKWYISLHYMLLWNCSFCWSWLAVSR